MIVWIYKPLRAFSLRRHSVIRLSLWACDLSYNTISYKVQVGIPTELQLWCSWGQRWTA